MRDEYADVRASARRLVREYGIRESCDIDIEAIAYGIGLFVKYGPLGGSAARLICKGNKGVIRVNDNITLEGQRRFCIAHEIGHYLLHSKKHQECTQQDMLSRYFGSDPEHEANVFAGELLMPEEIYRREWQDIELSLDHLERAAERFKSTITATAYRHVELGIHVCALTMSIKGILRWFHLAPDFQYRVKEPGIKLDATSCAGEFFLSGIRDKTEEEVPASAWLEDDQLDSEWTIRELCIPMPTYDSALSIIWIVPGSKMDVGKE